MSWEASDTKLSEFLLEAKAVELRPQAPFKWSSGWLSPIYCDNRRTLSYPSIRRSIRDHFVERIRNEWGEPDLIAGVATGGIPHGVLVAQELGIPFIYVRDKAKSHGTQRMIEGVVAQGASVVVVEDLISTGKSSVNAVQALKEAGTTIQGLIAIFDYGFRIAHEKFRREGLEPASLTSYEVLVETAVKKGYIEAEQSEVLKEWRKSPETWGQEA